MEQIVDSVPMRGLSRYNLRRNQIFYVAFEMSLVFLCVPRVAPSTSILVVARVANAVSMLTAKSLASQSMRDGFVGAALLGERKRP